VQWLPEQLPPVPITHWQALLPGDGMGGLAVSKEAMVVGCRDLLDTADVFTAFDLDTGIALWEVIYPAPGKLDYGNSPRATPLIAGEKVYLFGAFGHLTCASMKTGEIEWQRNLAEDYATPELDWGLVGSPLLVDGKLIVQPGGTKGTLVALDPSTGDELWKEGILPPGHTSFIAADVAGRTQVIGYDKLTLGGWDIKTGQRLWSVAPKLTGDFNVPTPIVLRNPNAKEDEKSTNPWLLVSTENNGTRLYAYGSDGVLKPEPLAKNEDLSPDSHTPVVVKDRLFGIGNGLHCLSLVPGDDLLKPIWVAEENEFYHYGALVASNDRVLCLTHKCELLLIDATADEYTLISRLPLRDDGTETLSHPAFLGKRIFVRMGNEVSCLELELP